MTNIISRKWPIFSARKGERYVLQLWDTQVAGEVPMMTDSQGEFEHHQELFKHAHGEVLIIGLGIGFCNRFLREKVEVTSITVIEKELEIIKKIILPENENVIHADGCVYVPDKSYDTIWWDTWLIGDDEVNKQIERYKKYLVPGGWLGSFDYGAGRYLK